jgi:uncharacterized membrane protein YraQ (UPF0718 family)
MDNIVLSPEDINALGGALAEIIRQVPTLSLCYLIGYSIAAIVHELWPRYAVLAYLGVAVLVAVFGGHR